MSEKFEPRVGFWRMRNGEIAEVLVINTYFDAFPMTGGLVAAKRGMHWTINGTVYSTNAYDGNDLVEFLGPELPKPKRKLKLAPALCRGLLGYYVTNDLFASAKRCGDGIHLVRWLGDDPRFVIEVEVDDE